jgi:two-component system sensor histidine kinase TctE
MAAADRALRTQLLVRLLVPLTLLLAADAFIGYRTALGFANRAYDRALLEIGQEIALRVSEHSGMVKVDLPDAVRAVLLTDPADRMQYEVAARDGRVIAGEPIPAAAPGAAKPLRMATAYDADVSGARMRVVELRAGEGADAPRVRIAETMNKRDELAREMLASLLLPQILLIAVAGFLVWGGVERGLGPLKSVQRAIAARSHLDRSAVSERGVPEEVKPLVRSINALLERLDAVLTSQNRFIADAAHNLKTPVAGLKAHLELMMRDPDPARVREGIGRLYIGVERLSRIVSQLLTLARNEPDAVPSLTLIPLDLDALALDVSTHWVPEALKRRIDLGFESAEQPVMISGDAGRLRELLDNLLDNAILYSRDGGRVTVRVTAAPRPSVQVHDDGPHIPADQRSRVFERFHRLLDGKTEGSGLGLAIAREIASLHEADIAIEDDPDGVGNVFRVTFPPLAQDAASRSTPT